MIINTTRSAIKLSIDGREITINGEAFLPGYGSPDFVVYSNDIKNWDDTPNSLLSEQEKELVINTLLADAKEKKINIEIE